MSGGKNVSCFMCTSINDEYGVTVKDSIDLQLLSLDIINPINSPALDIDNSGLSQNGNIIIQNLTIDLNSSNSNSYAIELNDVDAELSGLDINGNNSGFYWNAKGSLVSYLNDSVLNIDNANSCLDLVDHSELLVNNVGFQCNSPPSLDLWDNLNSVLKYLSALHFLVANNQGKSLML
jgi:hypothetical protein